MSATVRLLSETSVQRVHRALEPGMDGATEARLDRAASAGLARAVAAGPDARVQAGLDRAAERLGRTGVPVPPRHGKLLRPLLAYASIPPASQDRLDERFWSGALAVEMVHEASLLHDDVIDGADERRGRPTVVAEHGVARAVVLGDHYLTGAYRAAAAAGSFEFLSRFTEAVERTVAGEIAQGRSRGRRLAPDAYDEIIDGKSGELFGIAAVLGATVVRLGDTEKRQALGRAFGNLYQRIDDLLDYCHLAGTGKPPLQDYRHGKWSWILDLADVEGFDLSEDAVVSAIFRPGPDAPSAARRALEVLHERRREILRQAARLDADLRALDQLLTACVAAAVERVGEQERRLGAFGGGWRGVYAPSAGGAGKSHTEGAASEPSPAGSMPEPSAEAVVLRRARALGGPGDWRAYFGDHARTFSLAARLFPPREAGLVTGLYAYCRFTDDLVDDPEDDPSPTSLARRLSAWRSLSLAAYDGDATGIPLLDAVLREAAERGVDRAYPEALLDGVAMDLSPRRYRSWAELERYTFGVAGAVGGWMTQLFGLHDPDLLERAHALGHGMQLTNIARDVGEDWRRGRLYLPTELLQDRAVSPEDLAAMADGSMEISEAYRDVVRALIGRADGYYETAWPGIRALPAFFRRPVAAAASAYRGIHREIRRNGYDNLTERAFTSVGRKVVLAGVGILQARRPS